MKLVISYQPAKFQIPQLSELIFTEVFIRPLKNHYDFTSQYLVFKITHFVELNNRYQPAKFYWLRLSGSNFKRAGGNSPPPPPPQTYTLSQAPALIGLKGHGFHDDKATDFYLTLAYYLLSVLS